MNSSLIGEIVSISGNETNKKNNKVSDVVELNGHSNRILRVHLSNGSVFIIKQSEYDWAYKRFKSAQVASSLLQNHTNIISPEYLSIPEKISTKPVLVYEYLPYTTLKDVWPELSSAQKRDALVSLGNLLRKMHEIPLAGYGLLTEKDSHNSFISFILSELQERLKPTMYAEWKGGVPFVNRLSEIVEQISETEIGSGLVHHDLHLGNVLCGWESESIECIGFLDLEEAKGGCWESDIAKAMVLHDPIFFEKGEKKKWAEKFDDFLIEGYQKKPKPLLLNFFKIYHLLNLGLFAAMKGNDILTFQICEKIKYIELTRCTVELKSGEFSPFPQRDPFGRRGKAIPKAFGRAGG